MIRRISDWLVLHAVAVIVVGSLVVDAVIWWRNPR